MSRSLNNVTLIGNVGQDPVVRSTSNGTKVANFSLATSRQWKNAQGEPQEKTEWHRIVVWGKLSEIVERFVKKGEKLFVEGEIQYGAYEKNGVQIPTAEINADNIILLGSGGAASGGERPASPPARASAPRDVPSSNRPQDGGDLEEEDLPF